MLKVHKTLISRVSKGDHFVNNNATINFRLEEIPTLCDYIPYHGEVDVEKRIEESLQGDEQEEESSEETSQNPYIVNEILEKRFNGHRNQYEFLVSWIGYSDITWEVADNIPSEKIQEFERKSNSSVSRSGRVQKPPTNKLDYIKTFS